VIEVEDLDKQIAIRIGSWFTWTDSRLANSSYNNSNEVVNFMSRSRSFVDSVWRPTIYIHNLAEIAQHGSGDMADTVLLEPKTGKVTWVRRYRLKIKCKMEFWKFPFDEQTCYYQLGSTFSDVNDIEFRQAEIYAGDNLVDENLGFDVEIDTLPPHKTFVEDYTPLGKKNFSVCGLEVRVARHSRVHVVKSFTPTLVLVAISFISFFIPPDVVPGRMALLVTTFLMYA